MKPFLLCSLLLAVFTCQAQQKTGLHTMPAEVYALLAGQQTGSKAAALKPRVIACAQVFPGQLADSVTFSYSGLRSSQPLRAGTIPVAVFNPISHDLLLADTQTRYSSPQNQPSGPPTNLRYKQDYGYDANNRMITSSDYSGLPYKHYSHTYNAVGYPVRTDGSSSMTIGGARTPMSAEVFGYNSANQLISDSVFYFSTSLPSYKKTYTYDANGLMSTYGYYHWDNTAGTWSSKDSVSYSYYPNKLLKSYVEISTYAAAQYFRDSFGYSGSATWPSYTKGWTGVSAAGPWTPAALEVSVLNSTGDNFSSTLHSDYSGGNLVPSWKMMASFNADGTVSRADFYNYTGTTQNPSPTSYLSYYYERYNDPTSVARPGYSASLIIYPNPAQQMLTLDLRAYAAGEHLSFGILNGLGQTAMSGRAQAGSLQRINIGQLAPGTYTIRTSGATLNRCARFTRQ